MFSWNQLGWWVHKLPTRLKRWFVQLTQACLYGSPRPSRHAWSTAFHAAFEARFPQWKAFMKAQNAHQKDYFATDWRDLEAAFMARRPKGPYPLDFSVQQQADKLLSTLVSAAPDPREPGEKILSAYRRWEEEQQDALRGQC